MSLWIDEERTEGMVPLLSGTACKINSAQKMTLVCKRKSHLKNTTGDARKSSRLKWCNALRSSGGSGWLEGAHLLSRGVALVFVDEEERERLG